jgi:amidase
MFAPPTIEQIIATAARFGIDLSEEDARLYEGELTGQLEALDSFVQSRIEEDRPPLLFPARKPGWRPTVSEDPHSAWLWKCSIGGSEEGLLAGRTVSFKDHIAVAGIPLTFGSAQFADLIPDIDATVVTRVLAAGGEVVGKNAHHGFSGLRSLGGGVGDLWDAVNPIDPGRQTGGSSSGSAVAVAAGEVDISLGGDQGGSIRHPAAYCGVVGLKPTFGLVSHMGAAYAGEPSIDHIGPITRHVEDAAVALQAVAGYDGYDPRQGREVPERIDALSGLRDGVDGLRIGILTEGFREPIEADVADGVRAAIASLAEAGAEVVEVSVPELETVLPAAGALQLEGFRALRGSGFFGAGDRTYYPSSLIGAVERAWDAGSDRMAGYLKLTWVLGELSRRNFHGLPYAKAQNVRPTFIRAFDRALREVDVLALPTCPVVAPPVPEDLPYAEAWRREITVLKDIFPSFRNVQPFNYTGHPALAVPCGTVAGLPISLQLVGRYFDDPLLLRVAYSYEQSAIGRGAWLPLRSAKGGIAE